MNGPTGPHAREQALAALEDPTYVTQDIVDCWCPMCGGRAVVRFRPAAAGVHCPFGCPDWLVARSLWGTGVDPRDEQLRHVRTLGRELLRRNRELRRELALVRLRGWADEAT